MCISWCTVALYKEQSAIWWSMASTLVSCDQLPRKFVCHWASRAISRGQRTMRSLCCFLGGMSIGRIQDFSIEDFSQFEPVISSQNDFEALILMSWIIMRAEGRSSLLIFSSRQEANEAHSLGPAHRDLTLNTIFGDRCVGHDCNSDDEILRADRARPRLYNWEVIKAFWFRADWNIQIMSRKFLGFRCFAWNVQIYRRTWLNYVISRWHYLFSFEDQIIYCHDVDMPARSAASVLLNLSIFDGELIRSDDDRAASQF
jgi:hypothetical protein